MADARKTNANALIVPDGPTPPATTAALAEDIRPLKEPVEIPSYGWLLWSALFLVAIAAAATKWLLRRRKNHHIELPPPPPAPAVRARQRLKDALGLINQPKPFCIEVSAALREYLEEQFRLHAPERTTEEFLNELQASNTLAPNHKLVLSEFLTKCDLAKFAKYRPGMTELMALQSAATELISQTDATAPSSTPAVDVEKPPALAQR